MFDSKFLDWTGNKLLRKITDSPIFLPGAKIEICEGLTAFTNELDSCGLIMKKQLSDDLEVEAEAAYADKNQLNARLHSKYGGTNYLRLDYDLERSKLRFFCLSFIAPSNRFGFLLKSDFSDRAVYSHEIDKG